MRAAQGSLLLIARARTRTMSTHAPFTPPFPVPQGYKPHTERTTTILLQDDNTAFLNPVQEFNRDLSVAVIRGWNQKRKETMQVKWDERKAAREAKEKRKAGAISSATDLDGQATTTSEQTVQVPAASSSTAAEASSSEFKYPPITILEALSATGLRSIRYAKEIPDVKTILANDLSATACDAMRRNVEYNSVAAVDGELSTNEGQAREDRRAGCNGKVKVNEGDAIELMFSRRHPTKRVEVVDLDPYGTAAPFIDSAVNATADGGLMCVTCTDLAVLAGHNWPEKCYANYGGTSANAEYSHEVALRLVLQSLSTAAARYGRYIKPLVSLSIDFYVRIFITVHSAPIEVKRVASHNGIVYICSFCNSFHAQPFGRVFDKTSKRSDREVTVYRTAPGPPVTGGSECNECGQTLHLAGPMWLGPLHDPSFIDGVLEDVKKEREAYGTWKRIEGMLTTARDELDAMFYFTANKLTSCFHSENMNMETLVSALLNGGYKVSRSHTISGSLKSDAPRSFALDLIRAWVETHPIRMDKVAEKSPTRVLLDKPKTHTIDFTLHPGAAAVIGKAKGKEEKLVRYQTNPLPNWGPAPRAKSAIKRKSEEAGDEAQDDDQDVSKSKKVKAAIDEEEAMMNL